MKFAERLSKDNLVIFLFHGVVETSHYKVRNYTRKHLEKDSFYKLLKELKAKGHALSMDEVVERISNKKRFPDKAFSLTFDDGFENNYSVAVPILSNMGLPAIFYITTDFIENNHMSWIDHIEYCMENTEKGTVSLPWHKEKYSFNRRDKKIRLLDDIRNYVKQDKVINLEEFVSDFFSQCGIQPIEKSNDPLDLKMSWKQVKDLSNDEDFIIGGHSHHHVNLAFMDNNRLEYEIKTSISLMEKNIGVKPKHYSYPEGMDFCYSDSVIDVLKKDGIVCCPTAEDGVNRATDNLFHLKRVMVT